MPPNSNCHRFRAKLEITVMAPNHGGDPLGFILGPMGSHLGQKMGQNRKKLPCPKIRIFDYGHRFRPKFDLTVIASNYGGDPLGSILGPIGSHWGQKWVKTVNIYHAPKFEFSTTPRSSISANIWPYGYGAKSRWGPHRVHLGANGVSLGPKNGSKPQKNYHAPKFEFSTTPRYRFRPKFDLTVMAPNHGGDPLGSILGPMGCHWGKKMGQNRNKLPCPKFEFSISLRSSISAKIGPYGYGASHGGDSQGSILWPMGSHWGQKIGQNRKKIPCPKIRIFDYPAVIDCGQNCTLWLWRQITVGTP